jgi:hypothetical protein
MDDVVIGTENPRAAHTPFSIDPRNMWRARIIRLSSRKQTSRIRLIGPSG